MLLNHLSIRQSGAPDSHEVEDRARVGAEEGMEGNHLVSVEHSRHRAPINATATNGVCAISCQQRKQQNSSEVHGVAEVRCYGYCDAVYPKRCQESAR